MVDVIARKALFCHVFHNRLQSLGADFTGLLIAEKSYKRPDGINHFAMLLRKSVTSLVVKQCSLVILQGQLEHQGRRVDQRHCNCRSIQLKSLQELLILPETVFRTVLA